MIKEFELYHGAAIRNIIASSNIPINIVEMDFSGRINSFVINQKIGIHLKHSSKRLPPWQFTFSPSHFSEIKDLNDVCEMLWIILICGRDGVCVLAQNELAQLTKMDDERGAFVRIDRNRNTMYRVFGNSGKLPEAKARGISPVIRSISQI